MPPNNPDIKPHNRWIDVPVLWLAAACLLMALLGCIANIVISLEYADGALAEVAPSSRFQLLPNEQDATALEQNEH